MAFCRYCGRQLNQGQKCNCEESRKRELEFAKEQEILRKQYYMQQKNAQQANQGQRNVQPNPQQNPNMVQNQGYNGGMPQHNQYMGQNQGYNGAMPPQNQYMAQNQGFDINMSQIASSLGKRLLSIIIDTFKAPLSAVKKLGMSVSLAESLIIVAISNFVLFLEIFIFTAILESKVRDNIFERLSESIVGGVMKYTFFYLFGLFIWGFVIAGIMLLVSKYIFHENINFIQTYAVIAIKTFATMILFTAYVLFFVIVANIADLFKSEIQAKIMIFLLLLIVPIYLFVKFIFLYGYYEILSRESSIKFYEMLVTHVVIFVVSIIVCVIAVNIIKANLEQGAFGILGGLFGDSLW